MLLGAGPPPADYGGGLELGANGFVNVKTDVDFPLQVPGQ